MSSGGKIVGFGHRTMRLFYPNGNVVIVVFAYYEPKCLASRDAGRITGQVTPLLDSMRSLGLIRGSEE